MFKKIVIVALFISSLSCASKTSEVSYAAPEKNYFTDLSGCFLLYNMKTGVFEKTSGGDICKERFPACSSFKVPLAVMAFDAGILKDENHMLKWNGVKNLREELNKDHDAKTWMSNSVVWYSQQITSKMGRKKLQKYLHDFKYGNESLKDGITQAWLTSPSKREGALNISAYEQVDFMKKLWTDTLPTSKRAQRLTREITYLETSPKGFRLSGKTGSNFYDKAHKTHFGWFISHLQNGDQEYIAVTNLSDLAPNESGYGGTRAKQLTKDILQDYGLW